MSHKAKGSQGIKPVRTWAFWENKTGAWGGAGRADEAPQAASFEPKVGSEPIGSHVLFCGPPSLRSSSVFSQKNCTDLFWESAP